MIILVINIDTVYRRNRTWSSHGHRVHSSSTCPERGITIVEAYLLMSIRTSCARPEAHLLAFFGFMLARLICLRPPGLIRASGGPFAYVLQDSLCVSRVPFNYVFRDSYTLLEVHLLRSSQTHLHLLSPFAYVLKGSLSASRGLSTYVLRDSCAPFEARSPISPWT